MATLATAMAPPRGRGPLWSLRPCGSLRPPESVWLPGSIWPSGCPLPGAAPLTALAGSVAAMASLSLAQASRRDSSHPPIASATAAYRHSTPSPAHADRKWTHCAPAVRTHSGLVVVSEFPTIRIGM